MSFDISDKNKLIGMVQIDDYERVIHCKDCLCYHGDVKFPYCSCHDINVNEHDYCSWAKRNYVYY